MSEESYPVGWVKATLMINSKTNEIHAIGGDREEGEGDTKYIGFEIIKELIKDYSFKEYQIECRKTDVGTAAQDCLSPGWLYYVLGIAGESGEMAEKIKKLFRDKKGIIDDEFKDMLIKEMGDVQWYMARLADQFDIEFNTIAETNIRKLLDRKARNKIHGEGDNR
jgi:NTP pyrophosphatase (non-canonical NTP hydrolase)